MSNRLIVLFKKKNVYIKGDRRAEKDYFYARHPLDRARISSYTMSVT